MGLVDLHAHFLPGLDDGARNLADGMAILRGLAALGYDRVTATPHQKAAQYLPERAAIDAAYMQVTAAWAEAGIAMEIGLAAENYWDDVFFGRWQDGTFPTYDGGKAFLFEIRHDVAPVRFEDALFQLQLKGFRPVMAHPERYAPFWDKAGEARLERIAEAGCALLIDLGGVSGAHGGPQKKASRRLLESGLAHAVASDAHTLGDVKASKDGLDWIKNKLGAAQLTRLADENPRRILRGESPK